VIAPDVCFGCVVGKVWRLEGLSARGTQEGARSRTDMLDVRLALPAINEVLKNGWVVCVGKCFSVKGLELSKSVRVLTFDLKQ
jgi:hypothetical protein